MTTDAARSAVGASSTPAETAKEVGRRQDSVGPSATAVGDQATRVNRAAEPAPSPFFLSPWLWLVFAVAMGALSFILGRRLRST